jgi:hypothetical protein
MRGVVQSHRLTPSLFDGQQVIDWQVTVEGAARGAGFRDGAGDWIETVSLLGPVAEMTVGVAGEVETLDLAGVLRGHRESIPPMAYLRPTRATRADMALIELAGDAVAGLAGAGALEKAHALSKPWPTPSPTRRGRPSMARPRRRRWRWGTGSARTMPMR